MAQLSLTEKTALEGLGEPSLQVVRSHLCARALPADAALELTFQHRFMFFSDVDCTRVLINNI